MHDIQSPKENNATPGGENSSRKAAKTSVSDPYHQPAFIPLSPLIFAFLIKDTRCKLVHKQLMVPFLFPKLRGINNLVNTYLKKSIILHHVSSNFTLINMQTERKLTISRDRRELRAGRQSDTEP